MKLRQEIRNVKVSGWHGQAALEPCRFLLLAQRTYLPPRLPFVLALGLMSGCAMVSGCALTGSEPARSTLSDQSDLDQTSTSVSEPLEVLLRPVVHQMLFDRAEFVVQAGRPVRLTFANVDVMPHNLLISASGSLKTVGTAADVMAATDPAGAEAANYAPEISEVLHATRMLRPGESAVLEFDAPESPGRYPYSCTFPGHWIVMNGVMHVVPRLEPEHLQMNSVPPREGVEASGRTFVRDWIWTELEEQVRSLDQGDAPAATSWIRGRGLYREVGCLSCHQRYSGDDGGLLGPAFDDLWRRHSVVEALKHILEPSDFVPDGYRSTLIETTDGRFFSGVLIEETEQIVRIRANPLEPEEVLEIPRTEIEFLEPTPLSPMPSGLLSTLTADEVVDLMGHLMFDQ